VQGDGSVSDKEQEKEKGGIGVRTPMEERETWIYLEPGDDRAKVYTSDYQYMNKFDKLVSSSEDWICDKVEKCEGDVVSKTYYCPKEFISFRSKKVSRTMTDEQREAAAERLRKMRETKASQD